MNNNQEILKQIKIENFIWIIYLGIIGLCFLANAYEKDFYTTGNEQSKEIYRTLNIIIFGVALLVYIYFFSDSYKTVNQLHPRDGQDANIFNFLNLVGSSLIVIAGVIFLVIAILDENLTTEIAFS